MMGHLDIWTYKNSKVHGVLDILFENLKYVSEEYQLREKNKARVNYLDKILLARKEGRMTSMLTVLVSPEETYQEGDDLLKKQFIVLAGNHRLATMHKVREIRGDFSFWACNMSCVQEPVNYRGTCERILHQWCQFRCFKDIGL